MSVENDNPSVESPNESLTSLEALQAAEIKRLEQVSAESLKRAEEADQRVKAFADSEVGKRLRLLESQNQALQDRVSSILASNHPTQPKPSREQDRVSVLEAQRQQALTEENEKARAVREARGSDVAVVQWNAAKKRRQAIDAELALLRPTPEAPSVALDSKAQAELTRLERHAAEAKETYHRAPNPQSLLAATRAASAVTAFRRAKLGNVV